MTNDAHLNKLWLDFNEDLFYSDLIDEMVHAVYLTAEDALDSMKSAASEKLSDDSSWFIEDYNKVRDRVVHRGMSYIIFAVGAQHFWAFIDNYGRGSKMADISKNTFLKEYLDSDWFNKLRSTPGPMLSRPEGTYEVPNWEAGEGILTLESKGPGGINLEDTINPRTGKPYMAPMEPKFWLETAIQYSRDNLHIRVDDVFDRFRKMDLTKYFKGGVDRWT